MELGMFLSPACRPTTPLSEVADWYVNLIRKAEALDYKEVWIASHTCSRWARIASPRQLIARALPFTNKIRMGPSVEVLYQHHPVGLAAALAELDQISGGRLMFGFGAGGPLADVQVYGVPGNDINEMLGTTNEMLVEAIDVILNCWQEGGPRDFKGKYFNVKRPAEFDDPRKVGGDFAWHLRPVTAPEPRIAFAGFSANSVTLKNGGARGYIPLSWSVSREFADTQWAAYTEGAEMANRLPDRSRWRQVQMIYVAETKKEAHDAIVDGFASDFWRAYWEPIFERTGVMDYFRRRIGHDGPITTKMMVDRGLWMVGTPDQVVDQIKEQFEFTGGFGTLVQTGLDYSDEGGSGWKRSMELLAREVMPKVRHLKPVRHQEAAE